MKKLALIMMALIAVPAMAAIDIEIVDLGGGIGQIQYTASDVDADADGSLIAGIGIDVTLSNGTVVAVVPAMNGESTADAQGYGIFMGGIQQYLADEMGTIEEALAATSPVAPDGAPGALGGIGTDGVTLEFGALYDQTADVLTPPLAAGVLATIEVSETCTATITLNQTRGGIVRIGGEAVTDGITLAVDAPITAGEEPCKEFTADQLALWEALSEADQAIWCYPCFDKGDSNGDCALTFTDVNAVINTWPDASNPQKYSANADFNMDGAITFTDVNVLINNWPPAPGCDETCVPLAP